MLHLAVSGGTYLICDPAPLKKAMNHTPGQVAPASRRERPSETNTKDAHIPFRLKHENSRALPEIPRKSMRKRDGEVTASPKHHAIMSNSHKPKTNKETGKAQDYCSKTVRRANQQLHEGFLSSHSSNLAIHVTNCGATSVFHLAPFIILTT